MTAADQPALLALTTDSGTAEDLLQVDHDQHRVEPERPVRDGARWKLQGRRLRTGDALLMHVGPEPELVTWFQSRTGTASLRLDTGKTNVTIRDAPDRWLSWGDRSQQRRSNG